LIEGADFSNKFKNPSFEEIPVKKTTTFLSANTSTILA
jgi:hypothetical protein